MNLSAAAEIDSRKWFLADLPEPVAGRTEFPSVIEAILAVRGINAELEREAFLNPKLSELSDPFQLPDMSAAVDRILSAVNGEEKVALYGDYDVDGVTSLTLLKKVLSAYGTDCATFLPHRIDEGYGLSVPALRRCIRDHSPSLIIAVDCGTTSNDEVDWLRKKNVETIILDHHEASPDGRPNCCALVNPKAPQNGKSTGFEYLCSAGVVFKLAHAILKRRPLKGFNLRDFLDIVAVGTVADLVPLIKENRALVRRGLHELGQTQNAGLAALAELANIRPPYSAMDIGFRIGPRLNAAGRLNTADEALELLLCEDPGRARLLAQKLDERNRQRQELERRTFVEASDMVHSGAFGSSNFGVVIGRRGWHPGVVGIVASRISRKLHRPVFIVAIDDEGVGKGSGRSIEGVSLVDVINSGRNHLLAGGGHHMAAGISIDEKELGAFHEHLSEHVRLFVQPECLVPTLRLDAECNLNELRVDLLNSYRRLEPFGSANPEPLLLVRGVSPTSEPRILKDKHYRLTLKQRESVCDAIYFNGVDYTMPKPPWDVAFTILRNDFRGRVSLQMNVQSIRSAKD